MRSMVGSSQSQHSRAGLALGSIITCRKQDQEHGLMECLLVCRIYMLTCYQTVTYPAIYSCVCVHLMNMIPIFILCVCLLFTDGKNKTMRRKTLKLFEEMRGTAESGDTALWVCHYEQLLSLHTYHFWNC